jgi:hypothetical protein
MPFDILEDLRRRQAALSGQFPGAYPGDINRGASYGQALDATVAGGASQESDFEQNGLTPLPSDYGPNMPLPQDSGPNPLMDAIRRPQLPGPAPYEPMSMDDFMNRISLPGSTGPETPVGLRPQADPTHNVENTIGLLRRNLRQPELARNTPSRLPGNPEAGSSAFSNALVAQAAAEAQAEERRSQEAVAGNMARRDAIERMPNMGWNMDAGDSPQDLVNARRADAAIAGGDPRVNTSTGYIQPLDARWALNGRRPQGGNPMDRLQQIIESAKDPSDTAATSERLALAKANLAARMQARQDGAPPQPGGGGVRPDYKAIQANSKAHRAERSGERIARNAPLMAASSNVKRRNAGNALMDQIQKGPAGGETDYVTNASRVAARAAQMGMHPAGVKAVFEAEIEKGKFLASQAASEKTKQGDRDFEVAQRQKDQDFRAGEGKLTRENELAKTNIMADATKDRASAKYDVLDTPAGRAQAIQTANPSLSREQAYAQAQKEIAAEQVAKQQATTVASHPDLPQEGAPPQFTLAEKLRAEQEKEAEKERLRNQGVSKHAATKTPRKVSDEEQRQADASAYLQWGM